MDSIAYHPQVIDLVTHLARYCSVMSPAYTGAWGPTQLRELSKTLAHIYLATLQLPAVEEDPEIELERFVTEEEYERVRERMAQVIGSEDVFLDTMQEEMKYSDRPIGVFLSELLADLYQTYADTLWIFRQGLPELMTQAIAELQRAFGAEWGNQLLTALRQLHFLLHRDEGSDAWE